MIFHARCLSPTQGRIYSRYKEYLEIPDFDFPLKRLHSLITERIWSHPASEELWNARFSSPYQLWASIPATGAIPEIQSFSHTPDPTARTLTLSGSMAPRGTSADVAMDSVSASLRQRTFSESIIRLVSGGMFPSGVQRAIFRYRKFMLLMNRNCSLVPTMDIDLCWHTHQLFLGSYKQWSMQHLGRLIEHDDTVGTSTLNQSLIKTSLAWLRAYHEAYTSDDLKTVYFSKQRCFAGMIFPPYGIYMMVVKAKQLNQTRLGKGLTS